MEVVIVILWDVSVHIAEPHLVDAHYYCNYLLYHLKRVVLFYFESFGYWAKLNAKLRTCNLKFARSPERSTRPLHHGFKICFILGNTIAFNRKSL